MINVNALRQPADHRHEPLRLVAGHARPSARRAAAGAAPSPARGRPRADGDGHTTASLPCASARSARPTSESNSSARASTSTKRDGRHDEIAGMSVLALCRNGDVLARDHPVEEARVLERAAHAEARSPVLGHPRDVVAGEADRAGCRSYSPGDRGGRASTSPRRSARSARGASRASTARVTSSTARSSP